MEGYWVEGGKGDEMRGGRTGAVVDMDRESYMWGMGAKMEREKGIDGRGEMLFGVVGAW